MMRTRALALRVAQFGRVAGRLAVNQVLWTLRIEGGNPISDSLQPNTAEASRIGPGASIVDFRQSKKPTSLGGILGHLRDAPDRTSVETGPQCEGYAHGENSSSTRLIQSSANSHGPGVVVTARWHNAATPDGCFIVKQKTQSSRLARKMTAIRQDARHRMHEPLTKQHRWYVNILHGHYGYSGLPHS